MNSAEQQPTAEQRYPDEEQVVASGELLRRARGIYESVLASAVANGLSQSEVKSLLVSMWNAGELTRVVSGDSYRGSGHDFYVLYGEIPEDIFDYFQEDEDYGVVMPDEEYPNGSVLLMFPRDLPKSPNPDDPSAFYLEKVRLPQVVGHPDFQADQVAERISRLESLIEPTHG